MQPANYKHKQERTVALYNAIPSVLWSMLNLTPIAGFCYSYISVRLIILFSAVGLLAIFFPKSFFNIFRLGKNASVYKKVGISKINQLTQNGTIINKLIRRKYPDYKIVSVTKKSMLRLIKQTYVFEKFHVVMFVFFVLVTIYALFKGQITWTFVLLITNLLYNVYPAFLQQYIRIRLLSFTKISKI